MRCAVALVAIALALAGCRGAEGTGGFDDRNPLDVAAGEANLIVDPETTSPVGLYERMHSGGTDGLCLSGSDVAAMDFGVVMHFGPTLVCEGTGTARHSGDTIALRFDDADCEITLAYDGQSLRFPGSVAAGCAAVCGPRASMSGENMTRVGWTAADARRLQSRRDVINQRSPRTLCAQ